MEARRVRRRRAAVARLARRLPAAARRRRRAARRRRGASGRSGGRSSTDLAAAERRRARTARFARGDQYLRDAGVFYRQYDASGAGRARLAARPRPAADRGGGGATVSPAGSSSAPSCSKRIVADLYGDEPARRRGPAAGRADRRAAPNGCARWSACRRAAATICTSSPSISAAGPTARWWVLGDRTQAPSGAGFALENRVATSRVFSDLYAETNVHRLAGFFRELPRRAPGPAATTATRASPS